MLTRRTFLKSGAATAGVLAAPSWVDPVAAQEQQPLAFKGGGTTAATDPATVAGEKFAKLVAERTAGKVKPSYFGAGQLGGEREMVESVQLGSLGMVITGVTGHRIYDAFFLPYVFRDRDHMWKVLNGPIGEEWNQTMIKERGLRVLGYAYRGPRQLTTTKVKVNKPGDLKGLKIRVPEIAPMVATWRALGAAPTPMAWPEVFTALQTGTIEGQENPLEIINSSKLWEVQKYLHVTNHVRVAWITLLDERLWQKMTPATQKIMSSTWHEVADDLQKTVLAKETEYLETARKNGMIVVQEPELDVRAIRDTVKDVWRDIAPKAWGPGVYERIQATT
jgi:tripartite ATP-independent transporter DctP family solute receptor